jgi:hypothetical protein
MSLVAVAWSVWSLAGPVDGDLAPGRVASPIEARQREILKDALGRPTDPGLVRKFRELNAGHFAGKLPDIPVLWEPRLAEVGAMAGQAFSLEGMFGHIGDRSAILLHPNLAGDDAALARALSHEMVHAYLHSIGDPSTSHGPRFQTELKRLAAEGAFAGIVADDVERQNLRAWLDDEAARLDADSAAVRRESEDLERERIDLERAFADMNARATPGEGRRPPTREEVDALNDRRDAYNQRAQSAAARAERGRADLARFNQEVERYNLMLVYPDGIDEADLMKPR